MVFTWTNQLMCIQTPEEEKTTSGESVQGFFSCNSTEPELPHQVQTLQVGLQVQTIHRKLKLHDLHVPLSRGPWESYDI